MCGIAGLALHDLAPESVDRTLTAMKSRIAHRGPDGDGRYVAEGVAFVHRRLAIVDISGGVQPMSTLSTTIVYNGEVYNAPALRAELQEQGVAFTTRSDTEVVLRLYERDPGCVEELLRGMWAFAIHDRNRRRVVLSRDRFGIKPLFVVRAGRALAFASELGALRAAGPSFANAFTLDADAAHAMLAWAYVPSEHTIYRGATRVAPGTRLELDLRDGKLTTRRWYSPRPDTTASRVTSLDEAAELIAPHVARATREHLESDVPVACFLSGGIDSSLVMAGAIDAATREVRAFSVGFDDPRFNEAPHACAVAARLHVDVHVEVLREENFLSALPDALAAYDEPFGDSSSLATYVLADVVARTHKVALGGDGGDEVFAGYKKHRIVDIWDRLDAVPGARALIARTLGRLPARTDRTSRWAELLRTARRLARGLSGSDEDGYVALTQVASLAQTAPLVAQPASDAIRESVARLFRDPPGTRLTRTLLADLGNVLPNDMLTKVDRASMARHLEVRVPLLDHLLVETGLGLPRQFTLGRRGKEVMRHLFARRFGNELATRRKQGFGVPVERWLRQQLDGACTRLFSRERLERYELLSPEALSNGGHRRWLRDHPYLVWHAFALAAWCELQLGDGVEGLRAAINPAPRREDRTA